jgi:hypothetical protein
VEALLTLLHNVQAPNITLQGRTGSGLLLDDEVVSPASLQAEVDPTVRESLMSFAHALTNASAAAAAPLEAPAAIVAEEVSDIVLAPQTGQMLEFVAEVESVPATAQGQKSTVVTTSTHQATSQKSVAAGPAAQAVTAWGKLASAHVPESPTPDDLPTLESLATATAGGSSAPNAKSTTSNKGTAASQKASFASVVGSSKHSHQEASTTSTQAASKQLAGGSAAASSSKKAVEKAPAPVKPPKEINIEGHWVPLDQLVPNKFLENCLKSGNFCGRWCTNTYSHSMMECLNAHRDRYPLLQGGEVDGKTLLNNTALENLRKNTLYKGNFCTSTRQHDAAKCTYLHRKS